MENMVTIAILGSAGGRNTYALLEYWTCVVYRPLQIALKLIKSLSVFKSSCERLTSAANHHTE